MVGNLTISNNNQDSAIITVLTVVFIVIRTSTDDLASDFLNERYKLMCENNHKV